MKQVFIILIPVILLGIFMAGGFTRNPIKNNVPLSGVFELTEKDPGTSQDVLQIQNLIPKPTLVNSTPPPTSSPTITPFCPGRKIAIDLLIDTSRTMYAEKMSMVKQALEEFPKYISDQVIVGMQIFSSPIALGSGRAALTVLPISQYSPASYLPTVHGLPDSGSGSTYIRGGFLLAQSDINIGRRSFSGYEWYLIVLSDGMPESETPLTGRPYGEEFAPNEGQNPNSPPSIAEEIRSSGVKIITVGLDLGSHDTDGRDLTTSTYARDLLQRAQNAGFYEPSSVNELTNIYRNVAKSNICNR